MKRAGTLDILVENSGRVNYTKAILTERKGLTGTVTLGGKTPKYWENLLTSDGRSDKVAFSAWTL